MFSPRFFSWLLVLIFFIISHSLTIVMYITNNSTQNLHESMVLYKSIVDNFVFLMELDQELLQYDFISDILEPHRYRFALYNATSNINYYKYAHEQSYYFFPSSSHTFIAHCDWKVLHSLQTSAIASANTIGQILKVDFDERVIETSLSIFPNNDINFISSSIETLDVVVSFKFKSHLDSESLNCTNYCYDSAMEVYEKNVKMRANNNGRNQNHGLFFDLRYSNDIQQWPQAPSSLGHAPACLMQATGDVLSLLTSKSASSEAEKWLKLCVEEHYFASSDVHVTSSLRCFLYLLRHYRHKKDARALARLAKRLLSMPALHHLGLGVHHLGLGMHHLGLGLEENLAHPSKTLPGAWRKYLLLVTLQSVIDSFQVISSDQKDGNKVLLPEDSKLIILLDYLVTVTVTCLKSGTLCTARPADPEIGEMCSNDAFREYLAQYSLDPCELAGFRRQSKCEGFADMSPPVEVHQLSRHHQFLGASSLPDIVSHAYCGSTTTLLDKKLQNASVPYRILFAKDYNDGAVLSLVGYILARNISAHFDITIIAPSKYSSLRLSALLNTTFSHCTSAIRGLPQMHFLHLPEEQSSLYDACDTTTGDVVNLKRTTYDYVECNGGPSFKANFTLSYDELRSLIGHTGVVGITYFVQNKVYQEISSMLYDISGNIQCDPSKTVCDRETIAIKHFFERHGQHHVRNDEQLIRAILHPGLRMFRYNELLEELGRNDFQVLSSLDPTTDDMLGRKYYEIMRLHQMGLSEEYMRKNIFWQFRNTLYISHVNSTSLAPCIVRSTSSPTISLVYPNIQRKSFLFATNPLLVQFLERCRDHQDCEDLQVPLSTSMTKESTVTVAVDASLGKVLSLLILGSSYGDLLDRNAEVNRKSMDVAFKRLDETLLSLLQLRLIVYSDSKTFSPIFVKDVTEVSRRDTYSDSSSNSSSNTDGNGGQEGAHESSDKKVPKELVRRIFESQVSMAAHGIVNESPIMQGALNLKGEHLTKDNDRGQSQSRDVPEDKPPLTLRDFLLSKQSQPANGNMNINTLVNKNENLSVRPQIAAEIHAPLDTIIDSASPPTVAAREQKTSTPEVHNVPSSTDTGALDILKDLSRSLPSTKVDEGRVMQGLENFQKLDKLGSNPSDNGRQASDKSLRDSNLNNKLGSILGGLNRVQQNQDVPKVDSQPLKPPSITTHQQSDHNSLSVRKDLKRQLFGELIRSFRNAKCLQLSDKEEDMVRCDPPSRYLRSTSTLSSTSRNKVLFDIAQLRYIASAERSMNTLITHSIIPKYEDLLAVLSQSESVNRRVAIHQLSSTNYGLVSSVLNRVNYIHQDVMMKMHADPDALEHLPSALRQIIEENADFTVFDMILFGKATDLLTRMLLMSTIWFDGTNGRAFVSHYDDGLAHSSFYLLGQEILTALQQSFSQVNLVKYYAVAMEKHSNFGSSAISYGKSSQVSLVLFVNGEDLTGLDEEDYSVGGAGLQVFQEDFIHCLLDTGVAVNARSHPDFLSSMGTLNINFKLICPEFVSELIPQRKNRMVIVPPGRAFSFVTQSYEGEFENKTVHGFNSSAVLAVVYIFDLNV